MDNLEDAIRDAVEKNPPPEDPALKEIREAQAPKEPEKKEPEKVEEKKEDVVELDEEELNNALVLFRALQDPGQRHQLITSLAKNSGYDISKKEEQKQFIKDTKTILKEKLGENYDVLNGDALAAAWDEVFNLKVGEATKPVLDKVAIAEKAANDQKANAALESFFKRNSISDADREKISEKMFSKMKQLPASSETNVDSYLDDLYFLTHRDRVATKTVKDTVEKIKENAKEKNISGDGGNDDRVKRGSAMPSLDESVRAAVLGKRLD